MFTNGSTARECGGGVKGAAVGAVVTDCDCATRFEIQNLSATKYASAAKRTTMTATETGFDRQDGATVSPMAVMVPDTAFARGNVGAASSDDSSSATRLTKAGDVSPAGNRVHCNSRNLSGTCSSSPGVSSIATGNRNALVAVIK